MRAIWSPRAIVEVLLATPPFWLTMARIIGVPPLGLTLASALAVYASVNVQRLPPASLYHDRFCHQKLSHERYPRVFS